MSKSMVMKEFTEKEQQALVQFRNKLTDLKLDDDQNKDTYLIRWLRARDLNPDKADVMLRKSLKWRSENQIDKILDWKPPEIYSQLYPMEQCGFDKYGCPIFVIPLRFFDMKKFWRIDQDEYLRFGVQNMEKVLAAMKVKSTPEKPVHEFVALYDLDGLDLRSFMNKQHLCFFQESTSWIEEHYPGPFIRKAYCCFSPKIFSVLFSMIKHMVPKKTIERYEIFGTNKDKWASKLLEHIPADQLPAKFGGSNYEFDENAFANCVVPNNNNGGEGGVGNEENDGFITAIIGARKKLTINYEIETPNSLLSWTFKTESLDVGFSILFNDTEESFPYQRVSSGSKRQENSIVCTKTGQYTLVFDNSYSKLRQKTVHYKVDVTTTTETTTST